MDDERMSAAIDNCILELGDGLEWILASDLPNLSVVRIIDLFGAHVKSQRVQWVASWTKRLEESGVVLEWVICNAA
jgi:hypothetical protein